MSQLPAHLQQYKAPDVGAALSANLGSAMPPHVSIGGGRFTLIDASNNEIPVPTFDPAIGVYLDAAIIDVNQHMSRMYFAEAYDSNAEGTRPDCFSDNGVAASIGAASVPLLQPPHPRAGQPAATCSECPMAVWGSKISAQGAKIPACSQKQKVALLIPGFQTLFLLAVPPASHKFLREYVEKCKGSGINMADVITRISFVPGVQGTLQFSGVNYIDAPTATLRQAAYAEKKTDALVGRNDVPRTAGAIAHQPTGQEQATIQVTGQPTQPVTLQPQGQVTQVQQPGPFVPSASPAQPAAWSGPVTQQLAQPAPTTSPSEPAPAGRRKRRTAAEMQAQQSNGPGSQGVGQAPHNPATAQPGQMPQAPFPHPASPPATQGTAPGQQTQPQGTQAFIANAPSQRVSQGSFGMAPGTSAGADPNISAQLDAFFKGA